MPNNNLTLRQKAFFKSEAGMMAKIELKLMVGNPNYNTRETFAAGRTQSTPFVERHMRYLSEHPNLDPRHYLSNLKLMTKINR